MLRRVSPFMYTVILIPGLVSDHLVWSHLAEALAPSCPVVTAELTEGDNIRDWAAGLLARHEGPLLAVGHSMGGRVALEMARQAPDRMAGLVLANTGHGPKKAGEEEKRHAMIALAHRDIEAMIDSWLPGMLAADRVADESVAAPLAAMVRRAGAAVHERQIRALLDRPDATAYLGAITCPVLAVAADADRWSPIPQHQEIVAAVPDARLVVIEGAGHFAPVERPAAVTQAILQWIEERFPRD